MQFAIFALWIAYGILMWRRSRSFLGQIQRIPRSRRTSLGSCLLFGSAILLLLVMYGLFRSSPNGISPLGWIIITIVGTAFIHAQVMATGLFMSMAVTEPSSDSSKIDEDKSL